MVRDDDGIDNDNYKDYENGKKLVEWCFYIRY